MKVGNDLTQIVAVEVGIYFGGRDGFMAQHLLHCAQVGTTLNQMRGE
jgi:hypothetical protein